MDDVVPQKQSKGPLVLAILIITVGVGWLLTSQRIGPGIDWIWTLGLGICGLLAFVLNGGIDKVSVVVGPFFFVSCGLSVWRQVGGLAIDLEVSILVILVGVLMLIAQFRFVPKPRWFLPLAGEEAQNK